MLAVDDQIDLLKTPLRTLSTFETRFFFLEYVRLIKTSRPRETILVRL